MTSLLTSNVFNPDKDIPDLSGKVYVVTGGSAGIGFGIVAYLLQHNPAKIYIVSQKEEHADSAITELQKFGDNSKVEWLQCNLKDLKQTLSIAEQLKTLPHLDALICNAGEGVGVYNLSTDGIDTRFYVNHLSQMLLSLMLLPSSDMHRFASADTKFANLLEINTDIGPTYLYDRTKLAQVLFVRHLVKLLSYSHSAIGEHNKIYINATHPVGVATDEQKQAEEAYGTLGKIGVAAVKPFMKDPVDQGCRPALWAATSPEVVEGNVTGQYIVLDKKVTEPSSQAQDEELAKQLWVLSEEILRDKLGRLPYEPLGVWVADGMTGTE